MNWYVIYKTFSSEWILSSAYSSEMVAQAFYQGLLACAVSPSPPFGVKSQKEADIMYGFVKTITTLQQN